VLTTPTSTTAFLDSMGVNAHFGWMGSPYTQNPSNIWGLLTALKVRHVRDSPTIASWSPNVKEFTALNAATGGRVLYVVNINNSPSDIVAIKTALQGVLMACEMPNEPNLNGISMSSVLAFALENPGLLGPSLVPFGSDGRAPNEFAALVTASSQKPSFIGANYHAYQSWPETPGLNGTQNWPNGAGSIGYAINIAHLSAPGLPVWITECGYDSHIYTSGLAVNTDEYVANLLLRTYLNNWRNGVVRTYWYQFCDIALNNTAIFGSMGLLDYNQNPRPSYFAFKNLVTVLTGPAALTLTPITVILDGADQWTYSVLLEGQAGYFLFIWREQFDNNGHAVASAPVNVTIRSDANILGVSSSRFTNSQITSQSYQIGTAMPIDDYITLVQLASSSTPVTNWDVNAAAAAYAATKVPAIETLIVDAYIAGANHE